MTELQQVPTIGTIARRLGVPLHRVEYAVRSRGIAPIGRAGNLRIFGEAQVQQVAEALGLQRDEAASGTPQEQFDG